MFVAEGVAEEEELTSNILQVEATQVGHPLLQLDFGIEVWFGSSCSVVANVCSYYVHCPDAIQWMPNEKLIGAVSPKDRSQAF